MSQVIFNGNIFEEHEVNISINNRSFKYGDGCFETLKVLNGKIVLKDLHFTRLLSSIETLQFKVPAAFHADYLKNLVINLTDKNKHSLFARVRITIFRGDGGLYDNINDESNFLIQSWRGNQDTNQFNNDGFKVNFFPDAKKTCDNFSAIKSNNYLPYVMGALYAKNKNLNDCIILNCFDRIAEATIANIFIIANGMIKTPALTEGCVNGVMRKHLINAFKKEDYPFTEGEITIEELFSASEVFLTNALYGIRWVEKVGNNYFSNKMSSVLYKKFIEPLFHAATF